MEPSLCEPSPSQIAVKQEPDAESSASTSFDQSASYDDGFIGAALMDTLRNVPDPLCLSTPRGKKNPIVTLDTIKKELHHECKLCGKRFRKTADFYQHQTTHSNPLDCEVCSERFYKPWDLTKHQMEKHSDTTMPKCKICSKTFIEHWRLLRHMRTHSNEKKFRCDVCEKAFSESGNLAKHKKQVHSKDRPFKCEICDKSYPQKKDLQGHMLVHTMKRFACSICKEEFAKIEEKRAHVKAKHPNDSIERSFSCVLCNAVFNSKTKYSNHCLTHGERNFQCPHCTKKFHTIPRLRKHLRSHRVEEHSRCEICYKSFSQDSNMKRHIEMMHMRNNQYYCLHCSQTFELSDELRLHRETAHVNELPFKCAFCEKAFSHLQSLANHSKCHRNPDRHLKEFIKPLKRKRRAHKKNDAVDVDSLALSSDSEMNVESPNAEKQKTSSKKRGRPAKSLNTMKLKDSGESVHVGENNLLKPLKKRGRPKKDPIDSQSNKIILTTAISDIRDPDLLDSQNLLETPMKEIKQEQDWIEIGPVMIQEN